MKHLSINWFQSGVALIIIMLSIATNNSIAGVNYHDTHSSNLTTITVPLSSLLPPSHDDPCKPSPKGRRQGISLEVRYKYGPCSPFESQKSKRPTYKEILEQDEARIELINNRVKPIKVMDLYGLGFDKKDVTLPATSGTIGAGSYVVSIGLGTPRKDLTLIFDTGSSFTWTQCEPCLARCYQQKDPTFNPSQSSTYSNITCKSPLCSEVGPATSTSPVCSKSSNCIYNIQYGDKSFSLGYFAKDTLYLGPQDVIPNFLFGCGEANEGLFEGTAAAGLIGLGKAKLSLVSQTASFYGNAFSYCLPFRSSTTGYLTFGKAPTEAGVTMQYTPLIEGPSRRGVDPSWYFIDLQAIAVNNVNLPISPTVFSTVGTIIDSGTTISHLPSAAYSALQDAFSKSMSVLYPKAPPSGNFDTCFDLSGFTSVTVPNISLIFQGGARMDLPISGILIAGTGENQVCLAFTKNRIATNVGVLGNLQQLTFNIVYDLAGGRLGFGPNGCS